VFKIILFLLLLQSICLAQELITDRPDQTESALTVPIYTLQIETGLVYESLKESGIGVSNYTLGGTLFRYGVFDNIEFRLGTAYLVTSAQSTKSGFGDFLLGTKINLMREDYAPFDMGILAHVLLPIGDAAFNPIKIEPEIIMAVSKSVSERFSVSMNFGGSWYSLIDEIYYIYSVAMGFSLNDYSAAFIEAYGSLFTSYSPINKFNGGITYLISSQIQFDISAGNAIFSVESFWFISSGISIRFTNI
jgi:hypothetical protein